MIRDAEFLEDIWYSPTAPMKSFLDFMGHENCMKMPTAFHIQFMALTW